MSVEQKIGVIGGGSWATALVKVLLNNTDHVHWWVRKDTTADHISTYGHNPNYISSIEFDTSKITVTTDVEEVISSCNVLFFVVPSAFLNAEIKDIDKKLFADKMIVSAIKGIIPEHHQIPAKYFSEQFGVNTNSIAVVSGPCHAEEVAQEKLSYLTIASPTQGKAEMVADMLACRYIMVSTNDDLAGTEFSAILKNVYAIGVGICHGIGYGDNFNAVLISNAIQEVEGFLQAIFPKDRDVKSSAYLGDLLVTAYSQFSRNRTFGGMIGKGYSVKFAQIEMGMIAEGYYASKSFQIITDNAGVEMPIAKAIHKCLYENVNPRKAFRELQSKLK
jgi:glycerol-3-phosphate dehydrogenase (NAD(P)+)